MIGWFLNLISGNNQHPVRVHDPIDHIKDKKIVLDSGVEETIDPLQELGDELHDSLYPPVEDNRTAAEIFTVTIEDHEKEKEPLSKSIEKVFDDLNKLTDEEFDAELRKYMSFQKGECHPAECEGECDAMGWCEVATEYRHKTDHRK